MCSDFDVKEPDFVQDTRSCTSLATGMHLETCAAEMTAVCAPCQGERLAVDRSRKISVPLFLVLYKRGPSSRHPGMGFGWDGLGRVYCSLCFPANFLKNNKRCVLISEQRWKH